MKRIHTSADPIRSAWLASLLEAAGIRCLLRNAYLGGAIGELPVNESWPEIWVLDDDDAADAARIIDEAEAPGPTPHAWRCAGCGERIEGQFGQCWQCGAERSAQEAD